MSRLHIGQIGCGVWGLNILRDLKALGAQVCVVDMSADARAAAHTLGAQTFDCLEQMPPVDGIVVATPASSHADVINQCLIRQVPVFSEKPFTLDLASAEALAAKAPDRLFVMHVWRYHPGVEVLRDLVSVQKYGPVEWIRTMRANWTSPRTDVDSIWTMLPHDISILQEVLGFIPEPTAAFAEHNAGVANGIVAVLGGSPRAVIETSTRFENKRREIRVHCADAVLVLQGTDTPEINIHRLDENAPLEPISERFPVSSRSALLRELETFLDYLRGGPSPKTGMNEALKITRTILALRKMAGLDD
ncbi:MAG: Gfo/Idh/MocA family oxidoreductase [Pseudomonadota bacterium]